MGRGESRQEPRTGPTRGILLPVGDDGCHGSPRKSGCRSIQENQPGVDRVGSDTPAAGNFVWYGKNKRLNKTCT
eukprot:836213-Rhodomonas_salina.1